MSSANDVAVVLRTRGGKNFLVDGRGIDAKQAVHAAHEMALVLEEASLFDDPGDVSCVIQGQPLTCGSVRVQGGRIRVLYRVVHNMMILVVTRTHHFNALLALTLQSAVLRVLLLAVKSYDLSEERIDRKFGEVYLAINMLVWGCGVRGTRHALDEAQATMHQLGGQARPSKAVADVKATPLFTYRNHKRTLAGQAEQAHSAQFASGQQFMGMKPRPAFDLPELRLGAPPVPFVPDGGPDLTDDPFGDVELLKAEPAPESPKFDDEDKPEWASFGDDDGAVDADSADTYRPVLRLTEVWRAEVVGGTVVRAGLNGSVEWADADAKKRYHSVQFTLQLPESTESDERLSAALRAAQRHHMGTRLGAGPGAFIADSGPARQRTSNVLLRYHLQPSQCPVPLRCQLSAALQPTADGQTAVLICLSFIVNPTTKMRSQSMTVTIAVPALFELPIKASPRGGCEFDCKSHQLSWTMTAASGSLHPGRHDTLAALFVAPSTVDSKAATTALKRLTADVVIQGNTGSTLTGLDLLQGGLTFLVPSATELVGWQARLAVRLKEEPAAPPR